MESSPSPSSPAPAPRPLVPPPPSRATPSAAELSAIIHAASLPRPKPTPERLDERCWTWSHQTNARRALGREASTRMLCYLNFRHQIQSMIPIPGQPGAYFVKDAPSLPPSPAAPSPPSPSPSKAKEDPESTLPAYHWPRLDGRYLYFATGRETIARHLVEMGGKDKDVAGGTIKSIEERCEKQKEAMEKEADDPVLKDQKRMKRAMGLQDAEESESLTHLSTLYSTTLRRFHTHLVRIYSPALNNLARLPSTFSDGTQKEMLGTVWGKLSDGSAFALVGRMVASTKEVAARLKERRDQGRNDEGDGATGGGSLGGLGGATGPPAL